VKNERIVLVAVSALLGGSGCGGGPVQERCVEDGVAMSVGGVIGGARGFDQDFAAGAGMIDEDDLILRFADVEIDGEPREVVLRLHASDATSAKTLIDLISESKAPITLDVANTTGVAVEGDTKTNITGFDCAFADGKICAQVALGGNADGLITDGDFAAFNAAGGQVTIQEFGGLSRVLDVTWQVDLGEDLLGATSSELLEGCASATYERTGSSDFAVK